MSKRNLRSLLLPFCSFYFVTGELETVTDPVCSFQARRLHLQPRIGRASTQSFRLIDIDNPRCSTYWTCGVENLGFSFDNPRFSHCLLYNKSKNLDYQSENPGFSS